MKRLLLIYLMTLISIMINAQENGCIKDFDYIVNRITNDYPGYQDKVNEENYHELKNLENSLREKIKEYPDSCLKYLREYTNWFYDYHLRISVNSTKHQSKGNKLVNKQYHKIDTLNIPKNNQTLEGIWVGFWGNLAIVEKEKNKYIGVAINYKGYEKDQIIFECTHIGNSEFDLTTYWSFRNFKPNKELASLHVNNSVFEIHNYTRFVRQTDDENYDMAFLATYIPEYPNGLNTFPVATNLSDSTFYLRIPDFYSDMANDMVNKYWNEITSRPNLIIDIRNNGGGQDYYYEKLAELIYTGPYETKGVEWYSTEGIIKDWEYAIENGGIKPGYEEESLDLLAEMKKNVGGFFIHPHHGGDETEERDTVYPYPKRIGIIINENNASSAEQFILTAQHSTKVTTFGNKNTAGILDYSNITPKELPSGNYSLLLPATRSRRLPENPIDNIGIAPDVIISLEPTEQLYDRLDDWVYFVKIFLEYQK